MSLRLRQDFRGLALRKGTRYYARCSICRRDFHDGEGRFLRLTSNPTPRGDRTKEALWQARIEWEARIRSALRRRALEGTLFGAVLHGAFWVCGLWGRGVLNANSPVVTRRQFNFERLPGAFHGFSILHVSDFHFNGRAGFLDAVRRAIEPIQADLCVLTGDFRWDQAAACNWVYAGLDALLPVLNARYGIVAILGNNDVSDFVDAFALRGIRTLVNEAMELRVGGDTIWVAGVDDPHDFRCDSVEEAVRWVPRDAFTLLLAHSPEDIAQAAAHNVDLYLCGHTHGGQIRVPFLGALRTNARCARRYCRGRWQFGSVLGYTSAGVGTTTAPVRFNCCPEVTVIELRRADSVSARGTTEPSLLSATVRGSEDQ